jgi:hypothetical protein
MLEQLVPPVEGGAMPVPSSATVQLTEDLSREFVPTVARDVVEDEVATAARELQGQVPPGSTEELLHRLVTWRLRQRIEGRP